MALGINGVLVGCWTDDEAANKHNTEQYGQAKDGRHCRLQADKGWIEASGRRQPTVSAFVRTGPPARKKKLITKQWHPAKDS